MKLQPFYIEIITKTKGENPNLDWDQKVQLSNPPEHRR